MRWIEIWIPLLLVVVLPGLMFSFFEPVRTEVEATESTEAFVTDVSCDICVLHNGEIMSMDLDEYICGVLLGEMPAAFQDEALKAQAVAIRTYTLRKASKAGKHAEADLCTDPSCCQAYIFPLQYTGSAENMRKISDAVDKTRGHVLTFDGELIESTYFSSSGGRTEAAVEVWGADLPYLQAKDSPGEENTKYYRDEAVFTEEELLMKLGLSDSAEVFTYSDISYTDGDGVETVNICGKEFSGIQLRSLLGLRSTAFSIEVEKGNIRFITKGYGHRVGMSQYGAEAMALQGSSYDEILSYYYPDTQLVTLDELEIIRLFDKEGNL